MGVYGITTILDLCMELSCLLTIYTFEPTSQFLLKIETSCQTGSYSVPSFFFMRGFQGNLWAYNVLDSVKKKDIYTL
jgi:hypothetical protein